MTIALYAAFAVIGLVVAGFGYLLVDARIKLQTLNRSVDDLVGAAAMSLDKLDHLIEAAGPLTDAPVVASFTPPHSSELTFIEPPVIEGEVESPTGPITVVVDQVDEPATSEIAIPRLDNHPMTKPIPAAELIARIRAEQERQQ